MCATKRSFKKFVGVATVAVVLGIGIVGCGEDDNPGNGGGGGGGSSFTDSRDGKTYRIVTIGTQTWMAENLNLETSEGSWCYGNDESNCDIYGRLYDWATALTACPAGWHLSSDIEWSELVSFVGSNAGTKLKSSMGWESSNYVTHSGTDAFGFTALPGGFRMGDRYYDVGRWGFWWTATESSTRNARTRRMDYTRENVDSNSDDKMDGHSVRCVKDD